MTRQRERALEDGLVQQLEGLGYAFIPIRNGQDFLASLKVQLEVHNGLSLTAEAFKSVLNHLTATTRSHYTRAWQPRRFFNLRWNG